MEALFRLSTRLAWREVDGQVFAVTPDGCLHVLEEETSAAVFKQIAAAPASMAELLEMLTIEFDVETDVASADLTEFMEACLGSGIIEQVS